MERRSFLMGALAGAIPVLLLVVALSGPGDKKAAAVPAKPASPAAAVPTVGQPSTAVAGVPVAAPLSGDRLSVCEFDPVLAVSGVGDGRFDVRAPLAQEQQPNPQAFVEAARHASNAGRPRDTEVALIVACRLASRAGPATSLPLAEIQSRLGQHYAQFAVRQPASEAQMESLLRAQTLLARSLDTHQAVLGPDASKTRIAAQRLAALANARVGGSNQSVMGAFGDRVEPPEGTEASLACGSGRSAADQLVCGDAELARMNADIERLRMQAASVSRDPEGLQRRAAQARAQRDARCQDRACLEQWYAQRRAQLLAEFSRR